MGTRGKVIWWVKVGRQERRVEVTLDGTYATGTLVKPLIKGFLGIRPAAVTVLGQLGAARGELVQGAASLCNCASQVVYQHPWGTHTHALAIAFLPASISNLFDTNVVADSDNLVDKPSMQALAMGSKLAFLVCQSSPCGEIALAILPGTASLAMLLDTAFFVVVLWVVGTALAVQLAL